MHFKDTLTEDKSGSKDEKAELKIEKSDYKLLQTEKK